MGDDLINNLEIYEKVRSVPDTAKKEIRGGRMSGKTDINPMWRIKKLTELFGPCGIGWYYKTIKQWMEPCGDEIAAFVNIELFVKHNGEWSQPIFGTGGSMFAQKESKGIYVSDECFKMATTDAISVACKQLGIGADVYWEKDKTKYDGKEEPIRQTGKEESAQQTKREKKTYPMNEERKRLLEELIQEFNRTGYGKNSIIKKYDVDSLDQVSTLQLKESIKILKRCPDKAVP